MSDIPPSVALPPQSQERPLGSGFQAYTYPLTCTGSQISLLFHALAQEDVALTRWQTALRFKRVYAK